jgi:hypothetical protein
VVGVEKLEEDEHVKRKKLGRARSDTGNDDACVSRVVHRHQEILRTERPLRGVIMKEERSSQDRGAGHP